MPKTNIFHDNKTAIRACIYYEYLNGMPIFDTYRAFCYKLGDNVVDYREFERWFYRFDDGKMDLEDEKCSSAKNELSLVDLPIEVIDKVVENLDVMDRMILRKVCKSFRNHLDTSDPGVKSIALDFEISYASIGYNNNFIRYNDQYWFDRAHSKIGDCLVEFPAREWYYLIRNGGGHQLLALEDLKIVLRNPKLKLEFLDIQNISPAFFKDFHQFFERFPEKISVKEIKISMKWRGEELKILEYFSSKTIEIELLDSQKDPSLEEMKERIKRILDLNHDFSKFTMYISKLYLFPIDCFLNCRRAALHFQYAWIQGEGIFRFIKILLQSPILQLFIITADHGISTQTLVKNLQNIEKVSEDICHFPISNEEFFEIKWKREEVQIERKTKKIVI